MKIGIFSDVHGHLNELKQTLSLFDALNVDEIICCGDLVDKGSQSNAVIRLMQERQVICVLGNHDAKAQRGWLLRDETLNDASIAYLSKLPQAMTFDWAGLSLYLCHANPWEDHSVYVFPTRPPALFKLVADSVDSQIIVMGHTHHPMRIDIDGKTILNPGSIYGNRDRPERTCAVLTLPKIQFDLYDIDTKQQIAL